MKRPKGKLFALVAIFAALGVAAGTGAFTTVSAERTASVGVSGDASAALGLDVADDDYASLNNGELEITFNSVNTNAATTVDGVFTIQNNDPNSDAVSVSIAKVGNNAGAVDFAVAGSDVVDSSSADDDVGIADGVQVSLVENSLSLGSGDTVTVGMYIDTSDKNPSDGLNYDVDPVGEDEEILSSIIISADGETADYTYGSS